MQTNTELEKMLKADYIDSEAMMTLIRRYKLAKNPEKKETLRQEIFSNNIRLIRKMVSSKKSTYNNDDLEDIFNSASIAFLEGLEKFKPHKGFKFSTYIGYWIQKAIHNYFYDRNIIYIPKGSFDKKRPLVTQRAFRSSNLYLTYLDAPLAINEEGNKSSRYDLLEDETVINPEEETVNKVYGEQIMNLVNKLSEKEQLIVKNRVFADIPMTLEEVGKIIGVRAERVRMLEAKAFHKLRAMVNKAKQYKKPQINE